ncbi:hypothetical protein ACLB2K_072451 [Fragaria x ananassa]
MMQDRSGATPTETTPLVARNDHIRNDGLIPQLFTSVPAFNEAASYLSQTTSLFTQCFTDSSVEPSSRDFGDSNVNAQELVTFSSGETRRSPATSSDHESSSGNSSSAESSRTTTDAPSTLDGAMKSSPGNSSQTSTAIIESNRGQSGISIFQGLIDRVRKTVRGSADDIGWLQRDPTMPSVEDGKFLGISGMVFTDCQTRWFVCWFQVFSATMDPKIHSEASVEKNALEIKEYIEEFYWGSKKRVLVLGHSKGGIDAAAAMSLYWPDLKDKVAGLVLAQSPYGGSPIATDILREGQLGDYVNLRKLMEILICKVIKGDLQALEDLTYDRRREFLKKHPLPKDLPVVSFHTEAAISPAVLATLSRVAHAELPMVAPAGQPTKLPVVMPLGAAMAACAQLLQVRYGKKSDGLVTCCDAEVPGSIVVRPKRKLDHAWMVYSSMQDDPSEADASQVCEALLMLLVEAEQNKRKDHATKDD